ncbi:hypothetical protein LIER_19812 [Lithospermum erythrorhizon]|uniref:Uncharacterized protein n=1 Tax=Lithospermum erythrorhizon TaxID=34254 RepID=A0AAV3QJ55_LITER
MSRSSNSRPEEQGYNSDAQSSLSPQAKAIRADLHRCGSELFEKDLVEMRSRCKIPSTVMLVRPRSTDRAHTPLSGLRTFFEVASKNGLGLPVHPYIGAVLSMASVRPLPNSLPNIWFSIIGFYPACLLAGVTPMRSWRPFFFYAVGDGLPPDIPSGFTEHPKSNVALTRTAKHKTDSHAFFSYWEDNRSFPLYFYTDHPVLKVAGLFPIAGAVLGVLEALRVSFSVPDQVPLPPLAAPTASAGPRAQSPQRPHAPEPVEVSSSSEESEALSPLMRRYLPFPGLTSFVDPFLASVLTWAARHRSRPIIQEASVQNPQEAAPEPQVMGIDSPLGPTPSSVPLQTPEFCSKGTSSSLGGSIPPPRKRLGSPIDNPRPVQLSNRPEEVPHSSSTTPNHVELIFFLFALSHKMEGELKVLREEKAREEGVLLRRLKYLSGEHAILQERYRVVDCRAEITKACPEGVQAERDIAVKDRDILRAGEARMLQTHDRLLDQLTESQHQAHVIEVTLEGIRTAEGLEGLVQNSDLGRDLLFRHSSRMLEKTIRMVQAKLHEAEHLSFYCCEG